jgi:hypothetical protein
MSLFPKFFFCEKKQQNSMKKNPLEQMSKTVIIIDLKIISWDLNNFTLIFDNTQYHVVDE